MANEKSLGPAMNARPAKSLNQRPGANYNPPRAYQPNNAPAPARRPAAPGAPVRSGNTGNAQRPAAPVKAVQGKTMQNVVSPSISKKESSMSANDFVSAMINVVKDFSLLSEDVIKKNLDMATKDLPNSDRTISFECVDYLMSNLGVIVMGLVLDNAFKESFKEAIMIEMQLDTESPESKAKKRKAMKDTKDYESAGSIVIGVTSFTPAIEKSFMDKMQHSFDMMDPYASEFDEEVSHLSDDRKIEYGFIFSNFMYLIRAFTHNDLFMSYVITVIEKVKDTLHVA